MGGKGCGCRLAAVDPTAAWLSGATMYSHHETAVPIFEFLHLPRIRRRVRRGKKVDSKLPISPTETLSDSSSSHSSVTSSPSSTRSSSPTRTAAPPPNAWRGHHDNYQHFRLLLPPRAEVASPPVKYDHLSLRDCNFPPRVKFFQDQVVWNDRVPCLSGIVFGPPILQERGQPYHFVPRNLCVHAGARGFQSIW